MFFRGVVEDNNDPLRLNRCRVRVLGVHTELKQITATEGVPTDKLPWAECATPLPGVISGQGLSVPPPELGTWVWVFFEDKHFQRPVYFAAIPTIAQAPENTNVGFSDPTGTYPNRFNESDMSRLQRGDKDPTVNSRVSDVEKNVIAGNSTWSEPPTTYNPTYGSNIVYERNGCIIEVDGTETNERILIRHKSGQFIEVHPDGSVVNKTPSKYYLISKSDYNKLVEGAFNETIRGNCNIQISGSYKIKSGTTEIDTTQLNINSTDTKIITGNMEIDTPVMNVSGMLRVGLAASGAFTASGKVVTVVNGIIVSII